jgi:dynein heavy chain 2
MLQWKAEGLPGDSLSQENGIVITHAGDSVPLIIDPAGAAVGWLTTTCSKDKIRPLEMLQAQHPKFVHQVELAVRFGKTLIVLDVDGVEPLLVPLVRHDFQHQGPRQVVQLGDKLVDYHENFRLMLVTRDSSGVLPPSTAALVVRVNFTVTRSGLEGQLLGVVIEHERPELEKQKSELLRQEESFKVQLSSL